MRVKGNMPKKVGDITVYNLKELSEKLSVTKLTLTNYIKEGKLVGRKLGGIWYVSEKSLEKFFDEPNELR